MCDFKWKIIGNGRMDVSEHSKNELIINIFQ